MLKLKNIIVVDIDNKKIKIAKKVGFKKTILLKNNKNAITKILNFNKGRYFDYTIESSGKSKSIEFAFSLTKKFGGKCFFASHPNEKSKISIKPFDLISGKKIFGSWGGGVIRYDGNLFTAYSSLDGLSNDWISSIFEDQLGKIWFGTGDGLGGTAGGEVTVFDGARFHTYTSEEGRAGDFNWFIEGDKEGNLWFGMHGGGASRQNPGLQKEDSSPIFQTLLSQDGLAGNTVGVVLQDRNRDLWFGTSRGLTLYHPQPVSHPIVLVDAVVADQGAFRRSPCNSNDWSRNFRDGH